MVLLASDNVKKRFGQLFAKKFFIMIDERWSMAEIIEQCHACGIEVAGLYGDHL